MRSAFVDLFRGFRERQREGERTIEIGTTELATDGTATAIPSTADTTDTAGVNNPSEKVRHVPKKERESK